MPRKKAQLDALAVLETKEKESRKKPPAFHATRSTDKKGRMVDYVRHEPCKGMGCPQCDNLGFTKQYVL